MFAGDVDALRVGWNSHVCTRAQRSFPYQKELSPRSIVAPLTVWIVPPIRAIGFFCFAEEWHPMHRLRTSKE